MRVKLSEIVLKLRHPVITSRGAITQRDGMLVQVSDGGVAGWGEAFPLPGWPGADLSATRRALEQWAGDPDPDDLLDERFAHGAVELALLDLEARRTSRTQAKVLAGSNAVAESVELNALVDDAQTAVAAVAAGFGTVKLKVGASDLEGDVASVAAVRDAVGDDTRLRLDANGAWTAEEAVEALAQLEQYDIEYVEEPVAGMDALAQVASQSPIPVAVDESLGSAETQIPESIAVVVVKPMALGGPLTAYTAAHRWIGQGRKVVVTNFFDSAIGQHAALSVAAALPSPPQVHGAITSALFTHDLADLPPIADGRCPLPTSSPTPLV
ncbi:MAG: o-succinylbenzoate synthase [Acidimicrobiia bacterium]|nr:o-succinylbenzoate synthase [Acidimicrobiia bacterium]MYG57320.1 o-succinylbenzoate synthase [Acidimicrobiia bacterium]MYH97474.1 o-succinylbenzoate synthase [Acidimicrobiia bacterium]MYJ31921.1 o-succinylbenzoate synthase [Acidimicrobiia bacterium]